MRFVKPLMKRARGATVCVVAFLFLVAASETPRYAQESEPAESETVKADSAGAPETSPIQPPITNKRNFKRKQIFLGRSVEDRPRYGALDDDHDVEYWEKKAIEENDSGAMAGIGVSLILGDGVKKDRAKGIELLERARELGSEEATFYLGEAYIRGRGGAKDIKKGVDYIAGVAENENSRDSIAGDAYEVLADLYRVGEFVEKDERRAFELYKKSADKGNADSMIRVGVEYAEGDRVVERDGAKAVEYYRNAVLRGNRRAKLLLAICYLDGVGVRRNADEAYELAMELVDDLKRMADDGEIDVNSSETSRLLGSLNEVLDKAASARDDAARAREKRRSRIIGYSCPLFIVLYCIAYYCLIPRRYRSWLKQSK